MALSFSFSFLLSFLIISSVSAACDTCLHQSKASYFPSSYVVSGGACGYGSIASSFNKGFVAAASSAIYRDGIGCGGCFQIRCKDEGLCSERWVNVILTDEKPSNASDFVLSAPAFMAMARVGLAQNLKKIGLIDVEYKRVPCNYKNKNLSVRVEESSQKPNNLTIKFLYQGGQTDILAVDVARFGSSDWRFMTRIGGRPVWTTNQAPAGPLQFRMVVTGGYDGKWVWAQKEVLPSDWKVGTIYDAGVQITDVAQDGCNNPCNPDEWK